jgi:hypothetical protein
LHPDLCLLLSTSGSTGSPKLVRLSHTNVESNAEAIASYLDIRPTDRAITTLPMTYCYGLSVINSYLASGATVLLSNDSVVDGAFWERVRRERVTSFAGVPFTFELLDRIGFAEMDLPSLRYVTQAGGRLAPDMVRRYAEIGARRGFQFFVMYGQTEATARMAYVPPDQLLANPNVIGVPIPGGAFELVPIPDGPAEEGELYYRGPNVMLGYATGPRDLALGRTVDLLATGDIARRTPDGLYEIVGRTQRFVKLFGLRIDLQRVESALDAHAIRAVCTGNDEFVVVAVERGADCAEVARLVRAETSLPDHCVRVVAFDLMPRLANGKIDDASILACGADIHTRSTRTPGDMRATYAAVLRRSDITGRDTFVGLGGDSLSYVEVAMCIEERLGYLPDNWHVTPVDELDALEPRRRRLKSMETGVVLRALAIFLVVADHVLWIPFQGGAHVLLAIAGYNFARFGLAPRDDGRFRHSLAMIARILVPTGVVVAITFSFTSYPGIGKRIFLSNYLDRGVWRYWFIEVLVHTLIVLAVVFCIPAVRRLERARPFAFPSVLLAVAIAVSYARIYEDDPDFRIYRTHVVVFIFILGWLIQRASTPLQKLAISIVSVAAILPFFDRLSRGLIVTGGVLILLWVRSVRVPAALGRVLAVVAAASLYIYVMHFELYRRLMFHVPKPVVVALAMALGIVTWFVVQVSASALTRRAVRRRRQVRRVLRLPSSRAHRLPRGPQPLRSRPVPAGLRQPAANRHPRVRASR